jgi:hypothetical protein
MVEARMAKSDRFNCRCTIAAAIRYAKSSADSIHQCREPEVRTTIAASPVANFGFKAALES